MSRPVAALASALLLATLPVAASAQYSDAQIHQALMANRWCNFKYSQISGRSSSRVAQFHGNGLLVIGSNSEGVSSGPNGSVYGQSQGSERYQWRVQAAHLLLAPLGGGWDAYPLDAYRTSAGVLVLKVAGEEWSAC